MLITILWLLISVIGIGAAGGVLTMTYSIMRYLRSQPEMRALVKSYRIEVIQNTILLIVQIINFVVGALALVAMSHRILQSVVGVVATSGLVLVACLLTALSLTNFWLRTQTDLGNRNGNHL